jgi:hypothetical protein
MPYALISSEEKSYSGNRIVQLESQTFDVAPPLFWKECSVELYYGVWFYDPVTDQFVNAGQTSSNDDAGSAPNVIG